MREKKESGSGGRLLRAVQLPDDLIKGNILVSMHGQEHLWIENFKGISSYSMEEIRLMTRNRCVCITGHHLEIVTYTKEEIEITGHIRSLSFME